jgi:hypothetical protein
MQVAAAAEVVVVIVALADTVAFPVTMVAMMLGAIMAKPVEKERSATEMVPLAGTGVAYSAAEWQRRRWTVAAKTEAARRRLLAMQTRLVMACINNSIANKGKVVYEIKDVPVISALCVYIDIVLKLNTLKTSISR